MTTHGQIRQHRALRRRRRHPRPQGFRRHAARLLRAGVGSRRRAAAVRRPDRLRHAGGGAGARRGAGGGAVPIVAVLGNHDYESGTPEVVVDALTHAGVRVLDGEACEIEGVGIAGVKGFAGGFGRGSLGAWGEPAIKLFVQEALNEAMKLESALAKLRTPRRIAMLHYSPIAGTVARRAGGDLSLPGQQPAGGAAAALPGGRRLPRPRAPRHAGRQDHQRRAGVTTWPSRCCSAAGPTSRRSCCSRCRAKPERLPRDQEWLKRCLAWARHSSRVGPCIWQ